MMLWFYTPKMLENLLTLCQKTGNCPVTTNNRANSYHRIAQIDQMTCVSTAQLGPVHCDVLLNLRRDSPTSPLKTLYPPVWLKKDH